MPGRIVPIVTNEVYHVFNRGIDRRTTFSTKREFARAIETIKFYRFVKPPVRLSKFLTLPHERQKDILKALSEKETLIDVICFCLMPNHFHLLLRQKKDNGISKFLSNFQNSYTRYFNTRHERDGALLLDQFKAVRIETDEQLLHVSRYIHLNPYTSFVVKSLDELRTYPWFSLSNYLRGEASFIDTHFVLSFFKNVKDYERFVFDQADYQRRLKEIEHLTIE